MGMTRQEILNEKYGVFVDMISCLAVYNGTAIQKKKKKMGFDEALSLR